MKLIVKRAEGNSRAEEPTLQEIEIDDDMYLVLQDFAGADGEEIMLWEVDDGVMVSNFKRLMLSPEESCELLIHVVRDEPQGEIWRRKMRQRKSRKKP